MFFTFPYSTKKNALAKRIRLRANKAIQVLGYYSAIGFNEAAGPTWVKMSFFGEKLSVESR